MAKDIKMKFVLIGDGAVGKTSLLSTFVNKGFPPGYIPTVMDNYRVEIPYKTDNIVLEVWDTAGQENFGALRTLSYPNTDLFMICYSCVTRASFQNISGMWLKEVKKYSNVPFVLAGTKSDLIDQVRFKDGDYEIVELEEASQLMLKVGAIAAFQCSALLNDGVQELFKNSVKLIFDLKFARSGGCCVVL